MSEPYQPRQESSGSRMAEMFGFVTVEDRSRWDQVRKASKDRVTQGGVRSGAKSGASSMLEFGETNLKAKLSAAHRVAEQRQFDESHHKVTERGGKTVTESVSYTDIEAEDSNDGLGPDVDPDFEM